MSKKPTEKTTTAAAEGQQEKPAGEGQPAAGTAAEGQQPQPPVSPFSKGDQEQPLSPEERIAELEQQLAAAKQELADTQLHCEDMGEKLRSEKEIVAELTEKLTAGSAAPEPEKPKGPPPKPTFGDCRECVHFPANVSEDGRKAEDWVRRTKAFTKRPCDSGPCADKKFARA